jgi:hypothetical protein
MYFAEGEIFKCASFLMRTISISLGALGVLCGYIWDRIANLADG